MIIERESIRAILLTPDHEVLLMRILLPESGDPFWITPGGGLEPGESIEAGLRRELREELGLVEFAVGPLVWRRQHTFTWGERRIRQRERYHVVHVARFEPQMSDATEARVLDRFQWWPVNELASSRERLTPLSLAQIMTSYIEKGPPVEPIAIETLVD